MANQLKVEGNLVQKGNEFFIEFDNIIVPIGKQSYLELKEQKVKHNFTYSKEDHIAAYEEFDTSIYAQEEVWDIPAPK